MADHYKSPEDWVEASTRETAEAAVHMRANPEFLDSVNRIAAALGSLEEGDLAMAALLRIEASRFYAKHDEVLAKRMDADPGLRLVAVANYAAVALEQLD